MSYPRTALARTVRSLGTGESTLTTIAAQSLPALARGSSEQNTLVISKGAKRLSNDSVRENTGGWFA